MGQRTTGAVAGNTTPPAAGRADRYPIATGSRSARYRYEPRCPYRTWEWETTEMARKRRSRYRGRRLLGLLKPGLRLFAIAHRAVYRLTGGRIGNRLTPTAPTLFLTTIGRRSGRARTVPLIYLRDREAFVVVGSMGGSATAPEWWLNLRANPEAQVEVAGQTMRVRAEEALGDERARLWPRLVVTFRPFAAYQRATDRPIPVVILRPRDGR